MKKQTKRLEPPWAELDKKIEPWVRLLYDSGFVPWASCQGGRGHAQPLPFIELAATERTATREAQRVATTLARWGAHGFDVSVVRNYQNKAVPWRTWPVGITVRFWTVPLPPPRPPKSVAR